MCLKCVYKLKNGLRERPVRELKWSWYFIRITEIYITLVVVAVVGFIYRLYFSVMFLFPWVCV